MPIHNVTSNNIHKKCDIKIGFGVERVHAVGSFREDFRFVFLCRPQGMRLVYEMVCDNILGVYTHTHTHTHTHIYIYI
jgi:hypothetical protein